MIQKEKLYHNVSYNNIKKEHVGDLSELRRENEELAGYSAHSSEWWASSWLAEWTTDGGAVLSIPGENGEEILQLLDNGMCLQRLCISSFTVPFSRQMRTGSVRVSSRTSLAIYDFSECLGPRELLISYSWNTRRSESYFMTKGL